MQPTLFGWLIKSRCQISMLDIVMLLIEIGAIFMLYVAVSLMYDRIKNK